MTTPTRTVRELEAEIAASGAAIDAMAARRDAFIAEHREVFDRADELDFALSEECRHRRNLQFELCVAQQTHHDNELQRYREEYGAL